MDAEYNEIHKHYPCAELKTPKGWTCRFGLTPKGKIYKEAIDSDGFVWIEIDMEWRLYVIAFGSGRDVDTAIVEHSEQGKISVPINADNIIKLNNRRVKPERWYH